MLHSHPEIEISFKFIPKILMSKECIHVFGPLCIASNSFAASFSAPFRAIVIVIGPYNSTGVLISGFGGLGVACCLYIPKFRAKKSSVRLPSEGK
jgi:hypothetical protein